jgi:hypothetical protein
MQCMCTQTAALISLQVFTYLILSDIGSIMCASKQQFSEQLPMRR